MTDRKGNMNNVNLSFASVDIGFLGVTISHELQSIHTVNVYGNNALGLYISFPDNEHKVI